MGRTGNGHDSGISSLLLLFQHTGDEAACTIFKDVHFMFESINKSAFRSV